jgi:hypothetical protein
MGLKILTEALEKMIPLSKASALVHLCLTGKEGCHLVFHVCVQFSIYLWYGLVTDAD